jgi:hypothetical protein
MKNPQIGEVFYRVSFVDPDLTIPRVEPMIFAGTNLFPEHENPGLISYYFHHPHEVEPDDTSDRLPIDYFYCTENDLTSYYSLVEAIAMLELVAAGVDLTKPPGSRGLDL